MPAAATAVELHAMVLEKEKEAAEKAGSAATLSRLSAEVASLRQLILFTVIFAGIAIAVAVVAILLK